MKLKEFASAASLQAFCVDNSVVQANIVSIEFVAGRWYLFYY